MRLEMRFAAHFGWYVRISGLWFWSRRTALVLMKSHVTRYLRDWEISSRAATVNFVCRFCRLLQYSQVEKPVQIDDWDLQEFLNMSLKFLLVLSYVCNVLYVTSLMWGVILVVYFLLLCEQIATDNKYFIFLRLLLNNIGKCHSFETKSETYFQFYPFSKFSC